MLIMPVSQQRVIRRMNRIRRNLKIFPTLYKMPFCYPVTVQPLAVAIDGSSPDTPQLPVTVIVFAVTVARFV